MVPFSCLPAPPTGSGPTSPYTPCFPCLCNRQVTYLTSRPGQSDVLVGDPAQLPIKGQEQGTPVNLISPDGTSRPVTLGILDSGMVACPINADASGFFTVEAKDSPTVSMAVNVDPGEADTREIQVDDWGQIIAGSKSKVIPRDAKNLVSIVKESRKGMEISRTMLILALAVFILQGFLAKLFTNRMTSSGESNLEENLRKHTVAAARRT